MSGSGTGTDTRSQVGNLFTTGALSDLTVHCDNQQFSVHKLILYTQSVYFRKLFSGPWKDSNSTTLDLPDDDPWVLRVLIRYLYKNELDTKIKPYETPTSASLIQVYAIADKYDVPPLRSLVVERLGETCDPLEDMDDFIAALRIIDSHMAEDTVWKIFLPKMRDDLETLVQDCKFEEVLVEQPAVALRLLAYIAAEDQSIIAAEDKSPSEADSLLVW